MSPEPDPGPERTLYAQPPERFVAARDAAVAEARAAGDQALAARLGALRRPTVAAWLVNQLAHRYPDRIATLLDLAGELRDAQRQRSGARLRELAERRRATVTGLVAQARQLATAAGRRAPLPLAEVEATLTAALADEEVAAALRSGTLTRTTGYAGFGEAPRPDLRLVGGAEPAEPRPPQKAARTPMAASKRTGAPADRERSAPAASRGEASRGAAKSAAAGRAAAEREEAAERAAAEREEAAERAAAEREAVRLARAERDARIAGAREELRRAADAERDAERDLADATAELDRAQERHAAALVAVREARRRRRAAERAAHRAGR